MTRTPDYPNRNFRKEALTTPFLNIMQHRRVMSAWECRVLKQGYCQLLTMSNSEPTKCTYCLIHKPYTCKFRVSMQKMLFQRLFE